MERDILNSDVLYSIMGNKTTTVLIDLINIINKTIDDDFIIEINDIINDILLVDDIETNIKINMFLIRFKMSLINIYDKLSIVITKDDIIEISINKHQNILNILINLSLTDNGLILYLLSILNNDEIDDVSKLSNILTTIDDDFESSIIHNLVTNVKSSFFINVKDTLSKTLYNNDVVSDIDYKDNDEILKSSILENKLLTILNSYNVNYLNKYLLDIINGNIDVYISDRFKKYNMFKTMLKIGEVNLIYSLIINILIIEYYYNKENYLNEAIVNIQAYLDRFINIDDIKDINKLLINEDFFNTLGEVDD